MLHTLNLSSGGSWRSPLHELIPVGPFRVDVSLPEGVAGRAARLLVPGGRQPTAVARGRVTFEIPRLTRHEVVVID